MQSEQLLVVRITWRASDLRRSSVTWRFHSTDDSQRGCEQEPWVVDQYDAGPLVGEDVEDPVRDYPRLRPEPEGSRHEQGLNARRNQRKYERDSGEAEPLTGGSSANLRAVICAPA